MSVNNNIWELAEAYLSGAMSEGEVAALKSRQETDAAFASEFQETVNLISSFEGSGRQKRFRSMLRDIHDKQVAGNAPKKTKQIIFTPNVWRTAAVAAGVALFTSALTFLSLNPSSKKGDAQYNTISREVEHIKKVQAQQQAQQNQLIHDISKNSKPAPPPSDVSFTGTGFAITNDGYFVTAYHVLNDGNYDSVYIQTHDGQYFKANLVTFSAENDIAVLKVERKSFRFGKSEVPYTFSSAKAGLGSEIFTLGYPQDQLEYSAGYITSRNGYHSDNMQYTLVLPAGHGQSGSPLIDNKGNILGVLTAIGGEQEAKTYAVTSKAIIELLHTKMPDDKSIHLAKASKLTHMNREQMAEKMESYTVSVKVYKK